MIRSRACQVNLRRTKISLIPKMIVKKIIETMITERITHYGAAESKVAIVVLGILNNKN